MPNWNKMDSWEMVLPPSRPTNEELNRIKKYISSYDRNNPIAILGSTPEFRDLLYRMGFKKRFVFDKSVAFYRRMSRLLPENTMNDEQLIIGDWLKTLKKYTSFFKAILSDFTMWNIQYEKRYDFFKSISDALIEGGTFIDKVLVFDFKAPSLEKIFLKYEELPINLRTINDFSSEVLFCSELIADMKKVDSTILYKIIDNGEYSDKIKFFSKAAKIITPEGFVWYYGIPWSELSDVYYSFFSEREIYTNEDQLSPYYKRTKQYFNKK